MIARAEHRKTLVRLFRRVRAAALVATLVGLTCGSAFAQDERKSQHADSGKDAPPNAAYRLA